MLQWARRLVSVRTTALGAVAALAASLGMGVATAGPASALPIKPQTTDKCADVLFLGARGSGEGQFSNASKSADAFGPTVRTVLENMVVNMPANMTYKRFGVVYEAAPVTTLLPSSRSAQITAAASLVRPESAAAYAAYYSQTYLKKYTLSIDGGVASAEDSLKRFANACDNTKFVLAGYSQGAMVWHQVLLRLADEKQSALVGRIFATVLVADGDRKSGTAHKNYGSAGSSAEGIRSALTTGERDPYGGGPVYEVCSSADLVCDFDTALAGRVPGLKNGVSIHTQYANSKAVIDVAAKIGRDLGAPTVEQSSLSIRTTDLPDAIAGRPYSFQMVATGGRPPYSWGIDNPLPPGLVLTSTGMITGMPTNTYGTRAYIYVKDSSGNTAGGYFGVNQNGPSMDALCRSLGLGTEAWLPGQTSASDLRGRTVVAPNAAYTWSCSQNGPVLTQQQISTDCVRYGPGLTAVTSNPDNAYSWLCRKA